MPKLLIDTDVFTDYLLGEMRSQDFFEQLPEGTFYYSPITKLELLSSDICADGTVKSATASILSLGKQVELDDALVSFASDIKRQHGLSVRDAILVATALRLKAELVTKNVNELKKIKELLLMKPY